MFVFDDLASIFRDFSLEECEDFCLEGSGVAVFLSDSCLWWLLLLWSLVFLTVLLVLDSGVRTFFFS